MHYAKSNMLEKLTQLLTFKQPKDCWHLYVNTSLCKQSKIYPCRFTFQKTWAIIQFSWKFTLIEKLGNIHTTEKETLKSWLKCYEDLWIQKLETLTWIPVNCISCSLFSIFYCSLEMKCFYQITWQRKPDVKFWSFFKLVYIHKIPLKTIERKIETS